MYVLTTFINIIDPVIASKSADMKQSGDTRVGILILATPR